MIPRLRLAAFSANGTLRPRRMHFTREQPRMPREYRVCRINREWPRPPINPAGTLFSKVDYLKKVAQDHAKYRTRAPPRASCQKSQAPNFLVAVMLGAIVIVRWTKFCLFSTSAGMFCFGSTARSRTARGGSESRAPPGFLSDMHAAAGPAKEARHNVAGRAV